MGSSCCKPKYLRQNNQKKIILLLVGLDNAGKTTAAKGLSGDIVETTIPTVGFTAVKPKTKGYDVTIYDLGGGVQIRDIWRSYFHSVHGVIYVVDASDLSRIEESKRVLENLLFNERLAGKPVLVLANKQDQPNALDELDIVEILQLESLVNQQKCHTLVKICSATDSSSDRKKNIDKRLLSGYRWLLQQVVKQYDVLNYRVESDSRVELEKFEVQRALQRKRFEEAEQGVQVTNGTETVINHSNTNGFSNETDTANSKNLTSVIRDQLEEKNDGPRFAMSKGFRSNKIHPRIGGAPELSREPEGPKISNSLHSSNMPSMTLRALTSPLHDPNLSRQRIPTFTYSSNDRPLTSRSLGGHEVGAWGLDRELDVIYPAQITKHIINEDEVKDEIIIEYLKKD